MTTAMFLTESEVATLTGRSRKTQQIAQLRTMSLPFWVNAMGHPIIPRSAIEGRPSIEPEPRKKWVPNAMQPGYESPVPTRKK